MTSAPLDPLLGRTLNERYVIRSRIARGGMAMVYLATDLRLERKVAVKVMHEHLAEDENFTRRFDREARSAARLAHANLVNVFDQGHDLGRSYLVMEYLPNITLRQLLKQQTRLTLDQALEISDAVLSGLAAAHSAGIVHRDLKPENVLLVDDGRIKIGDFGLARAVSANTTTGQALLGTIAYLSPELVTRGIADERSDLYAFGIMLYEMITGVQPFTGEQPMQIAYQHAHSEVPAPSAHSQVSTPIIDEFVLWLTQREAALRPIDAGEALEHLHVIRSDPYAPPSGVLRGFEDTAEPLAATTVIERDFEDAAETTFLTPSTSILEPLQSSALAASGADATDGAGKQGPTAVDRARTRAAGRSKRGKLIAVAAVLLVALVAGLGYWFGQGPGSRVSVPALAGLTMEAAATELQALDLRMEPTSCSSLTVEPGLAADSQPAAGTRLDRGETVTVCESTGPQMLEVPPIVGLSLDGAKQAIADAKFTFGEVIDTRFSDAGKNVVLAAIDENDESLGDTFPEQGTINLIVSAGQVPAVSTMSVENATATLGESGLNVDSSQNTEAYSEEIPKGSVIDVVLLTDPVRPGDSVGLQVSLGPELFAIPDVSGMDLQQAMDALSAAGFNPTTLVPDRLREFAEASGTRPEAGEKVAKGTDVRVTAQVSL